MLNYKPALIALALASLALPASAHRPWLLPSATLVDGKEPVVLVDGAVSENYFDFDHMPLRMDAVAITGPDGQAIALPAVLGSRYRNSFDLKMALPGTYRIALVNTTVIASYKAAGEVKRFRGSEEAFARDVPANAEGLAVNRQHTRIETFVSANQTSAVKPSGKGLELEPLTHPNDLHAGEQAKWRFTLDGKPLANFDFSLIAGGVKYRGVLGEVRLTTDATGTATFKLPDAGMYALNAAFPQPRDKAPDGNPPANRYSYSATLEILPQ